MPQELSGTKKVPASKGLAISTQGERPLTKKQKEFNKLVKKIESLRKELDATGKMLNSCLQFYSGYIHPLEQEVVTLRTSCIKMFFPFYKDKLRLSKKEKEVLGEIISLGIDDIMRLSPKELDDEMKAIFRSVNGITYEQAKRDSFEEMKDEMTEMFDEMGVEINLNDFDAGMTEEEMMRKMKEIQDNLEKEAEILEEKEANRKKTKKQQEKEDRAKQVEEARKKNIGSIFKQLAKVFHPDLEKDETQKVLKEDLMKQLTVAYEKNDLHALLKLEIEWIQKEENDITKLTDDKLGIYNEVLKQQVEEMLENIDMLEDHPRYMPLKHFTDCPSDLTLNDLAGERTQLQEFVESLRQDEQGLKSKDAIRTVQGLIKTYKQHSAMNNEMEEMMELFMKLKKGRR